MVVRRPLHPATAAHKLHAAASPTRARDIFRMQLDEISMRARPGCARRTALSYRPPNIRNDGVHSRVRELGSIDFSTPQPVLYGITLVRNNIRL